MANPMLSVPDWFSWENQGAGVAVADLGGGAPSLIVFTIDNPVEQNQAFLRFGAKRRRLIKESEPEKTVSYLKHP